jgi:6-phosphogluconolactonase (cycloisomerase 2 family)
LTWGIPGGFSIDSQGKFVYVAEVRNSVLRVAVLEIGPGSTLTFVHTYNFSKVSDDDGATDALLSANGKYLYMTDESAATIVTLRVDDVTGALRHIFTTSDGMFGDHPQGLATTKNGAFVFSGGLEPLMGIFAAGKDGSLTSLGTFPLMGTPNWLAARMF